MGAILRLDGKDRFCGSFSEVENAKGALVEICESAPEVLVDSSAIFYFYLRCLWSKYYAR